MLLVWDCPPHLLPLTCGDVFEILSLELGLFSVQDVRLRGSGGRRFKRSLSYSLSWLEKARTDS